MKLLAVAALVLATTGCTAQQSPVGIAVELYKGCMIGFTQAEVQLPTTAREIDSLANALDEKCTSWTHIWLPAMLHKDRPELRFDELLRFNEHKKNLLAAYKKEIKLTMISSK